MVGVKGYAAKWVCCKMGTYGISENGLNNA